jgi:transposase InsO family protein
LKYLYRWSNSPREYAYAVVDDFSREAVARIRANRTSGDAVTFLEEVLTALPYRIEAVMTDNDLIFTMRHAFHSQRQTRFQQACRSLGIQHWLAQPHHPQSNGKVERFFRTLDEECLLIRKPGCSELRIRDLEEFLWYLQPSAASSESAWPDAGPTAPSLLWTAPDVTYVLGQYSWALARHLHFFAVSARRDSLLGPPQTSPILLSTKALFRPLRFHSRITGRPPVQSTY